MTNLEALRRGMVGEPPHGSFASTGTPGLGPRSGWRETVGARIAQVDPAQVVVELDANASHRHEGGVVQGGVITQIADAAMGMSLMTEQDEGHTNTTIELKINFLRPVVEGRLRAIGRVVDMHGDLLFSEADVVDSDGRLVARASSTCLPLQRPWGRQ